MVSAIAKNLVSIRAATTADTKAILWLERMTADPWKQSPLIRALCHHRTKCLVVHQHGDVIAWACGRHVAGGAHILRVVVTPECRRQGYGRRLVGELRYLLPGLSVAEFPHEPHYDQACLFFRRIGFEGSTRVRDGITFIRFAKER